MNRPPATLVFVTYRSAAVIGAALAAARRGYNAGLLECVVVDNASDDASAAVVQAEHPWVHLVPSPVNLGYGRACNVGLARTRTRYVAFLNADAILEPADLATLIQFLDTRPRAALVGPAIIGDEEHGLQEAGGLPTPGSIVRMAAGCAPGWDRRVVEPGAAPWRTDWLCGAVLMGRREVLEELGGFDERFFLYFEETDLCRRVRARGWELWAVGTAVARHVGNLSAKTTHQALIGGCIADHYYASRFHYLAKHHGRLAAVLTEGAELALLGARALGKRCLGRADDTSLALRLGAPFARRPAPPAALGGQRSAGSGQAPEVSVADRRVRAER